MNIDINKNKEEFVNLLKSTQRDGVDGMIEDLEKLGFFTAPASAGHHLNVAGGLTVHSLNVCKAALAVWEAMKPLEPSLNADVSRESIIIASLLHDVCKADAYIPSVRKRRTRIGTWEDCEGYKMTFKNFPLGHGEKSLAVTLLSGIELTDAEMLAIRWHMGAWGVNMSSFEDMRSYDAARALYPLVTIVQTADGLAASVMERTASQIDDL
ncbi:MAG: HD family phosphohydrolase [Prevotella sp.]|nr:HD family phosphohydrolase [Prevotella sp.]MDD7047247.1 HD family phosphohydrolase [Prevotella sp.]MDY5545831.1 HD family phosphohydrolase [Prevotella sp.]